MYANRGGGQLTPYQISVQDEDHPRLCQGLIVTPSKQIFRAGGGGGGTNKRGAKPDIKEEKHSKSKLKAQYINKQMILI